ncbi:peptidoglycan DD-metalloendopeptidase family protein [Mammaliicoccus sciuri]|uniref:peptidoglycan DD-metalloendopeptidase family protein n=1 Tax=Mammaliicoccus sciuri TaxID=1296 RepID=UPI001FB1DAC9|nr:peptidoglycan DD-metalloendopeptidase family protein [Mammaliicoccus sciuri]MCJ1783084.1 peptidoglycan DD-metalloendopeptidase family protein [Mammaliicoccus sciuri]
MATIKELQAKFTANQSGMESAFSAIANRLNDIEKASDRAARNIEKNMTRGMNRVFKTGEGFEKVGSTFTNISKKSEEVGSNLTNKITKPAMIAGGALASITIGKGFGRLVEIDNAKAKLDGLGHSSESVQKIMDNALESVKGTSFGLGEAATTASSAVAAGIKPGKELTRYLSLTGDAAAIAGSSMGEMGSIINKVQTSNKAYNGELQQLSERGIPIYQWIAKEAGVTADEVFKMASDGEISSKMFLNAIETNIGGAAKKMGQKSFTASLANMWAAVGRLGASFLDAGGKGGGFFSKMKPLMNDLTTAIDGMEGSATKWGETLGQVLDKVVNGIKGIVNWYNSLDKSTQKLIASIMQWSTLILVGLGPVLMIFSKLTGIIGAIFGPFGKFLQFFAKFSTAAKSSEGAIAGITKVFPKLGWTLAKLTGPVGWITLGVIALGTAFVVAYKKSETFRNIVNAALNGVKQTFITIGNIIKGFFQLFKGNGQDGVITLSKILPPNVVVGLTNFATRVKTTFYQVVNAISTFARSIGTQISAFWAKNGTEIMTALRNVGSFISTTFKFIWGNVIKPIMTLIWNLMKILWPAIRLLIVSVWHNIKGVIQGATNIILGIIKVFSSLLTGNWKGVWQGIVQILKGAVVLAWNLVQLWFVGKILSAVKVGLGLLKGVVSSSWRFIHTFIATTAYAIWNKVKSSFSNLYKSTRNIFTNLFKWCSNLWTLLKNKITSLGQSIWNNIRNKFAGLSKSTRTIFSNLFNYARDLWTRMKNFITNLAQNIWTNVRNKFSGMSKSSREIFGRLFNSARDIFTNIKNRVTSLAHGARDNVVKGFKAMYDRGKSWIDKLKKFLSGSVSGFKSIASKVGKGIANGAISGLNKMIDGVNWLSKKIMDKKLIKDKITPLHTGTGGSNGVKTNSKGQLQEDTLAMVNDRGPGNGKGRNGHQELIRDKDGSLFAPKGRNVVLPLRKGMEVINGRNTQSMIENGNIAAFHSGTADKPHKKHKAEKRPNALQVGLASLDSKYNDLKSYGSKKTAELVAKGSKVALDAWDYVENPSKLVDTVMNQFGVNFDDIKAVYGDIIKHSYNKLKNSLKKKVMEWFVDASDGGGGGSNPFANNPAYHWVRGFNPPSHYGLDYGANTGTKIPSSVSGRVVKAWSSPYGGGNEVQVASGGMGHIFMHMNKRSVQAGDMVKQGQKLGEVGSTGNSSGPHIHWQVNKGTSYASNNQAIDPLKWAKDNPSKGGGGGMLSNVITALKIAKLPVTQKYINAWMKQIETESGGNARAMGGNDGLADGNAMGLVQVKPGTFKANQGKGMGDIWNPVHNLVAGMNYASRRYGNNLLDVIGHGHGYANGGIINSPEIAWLAEGGFSESVISHDPSAKARSKVIWDRTGEMLGFSEDAELLRGIITAINEGNSLQQINNRDTNRIANKDTNVYMDSKRVAQQVSKQQGSMYKNNSYVLGGG